jgi:hypothetical protein
VLTIQKYFLDTIPELSNGLFPLKKQYQAKHTELSFKDEVRKASLVERQ